MGGLKNSLWAPHGFEARIKPPTSHSPQPSTPNSHPSTPQLVLTPVPAIQAPALRLPTPPAHSAHTAPSSARHAAQELTRYTKLVRRLRWKLPYLADGYHAAVMGSAAISNAEAELMFKLDFYEYYMLLERALVHLLGVYGITVSGDRTKTQQHGARGVSPHENSFSHQYHANVLAALDDEASPLHQTLGKGTVRIWLGRAKDLRNRWKYAEEDEGTSPAANVERNGRSQLLQGRGLGDSRHASPAQRKRFGPTPLSSYEVERMLECIFTGFDAAFVEAEKFVVALGVAQGGLSDTDEVDMDWRAEDEDDRRWDFMVEAMDWEAV